MTSDGARVHRPLFPYPRFPIHAFALPAFQAAIQPAGSLKGGFRKAPVGQAFKATLAFRFDELPATRVGLGLPDLGHRLVVQMSGDQAR